MPNETPLHVAIIPDGNRRWAKAHKLDPWKGHEKAIENFKEITQWCRKDSRISTLTVWCFSTENWKRNSQEINKLMAMLEEYLRKEREGFLEQRTRFLHSGRRDRLPSSLVALIEEVEAETRNNDAFALHLAVDYGGKDEILRAIRKLKQTNIDEETMCSALDHPELPDIDFIVRTSGEQRTSNFFLWQSTYAEWLFSEKLFPDFNAQDLENAVEEYAVRARRFGA